MQIYLSRIVIILHFHWCEPVRKKSRCEMQSLKWHCSLFYHLEPAAILESGRFRLLIKACASFCRSIDHSLKLFFFLFSTWLPGAGYFPVEKRYRLWIQDPWRQWTWRAGECRPHLCSSASTVLVSLFIILIFVIVIYLFNESCG